MIFSKLFFIEFLNLGFVFFFPHYLPSAYPQILSLLNIPPFFFNLPRCFSSIYHTFLYCVGCSPGLLQSSHLEYNIWATTSFPKPMSSSSLISKFISLKYIFKELPNIRFMASKFSTSLYNCKLFFWTFIHALER